MFQMFGRLTSFGLVIYFALVLILTSTPMHAQVSGATLTGTVTDPSGSAVPNAQVTITNKATDVPREITTDSAGFYSAPNLLPGNYEVRVAAEGFSTIKEPSVALAVGTQQVLNVSMKIGNRTQTIEVTETAPNVQLTSSMISAQVEAATVRELPLNGRSWTDLAALQPGVNALHNQAALSSASSNRGNRGFGNELTISGARPQQNNYRLDGVSINDYSNGGPGSVIGNDLGVDAIQEFSVLTTNYSAEYGKTAGGVVNAITRSGTNEFHGSAYEFFRNSALDARNFFDKGSTPPFRRNQFGATGGAPIRKDRTFIFGDYEAIRQSKGVSYTDTVPSAAARAGNLSTGTVAVSPAVAKDLGLYPLPNAGLLPGGDIGVFTFAANQRVSENFFTIRADSKISDKDSLFGTYLYDDTDYRTPDALNIFELSSHTRRQIVALEETHIFSSALVNTVRGGFNRERAANTQSTTAINPLATDMSLAAVPGRTAPQVIVTSLTTSFGGINSTPAFFFHWNTFQAYDDAFFTAGTHAFKFGVAVERMQLNLLGLSSPNGQFTYATLSNFLVDKPARFTAGFPSTLTPRGERQTLFGTYFQDDWRIRPNLTLNLGLRYEITTVPTEVQGKMSNLVNITDPIAHLGDPFFLNPTRRNFEPRVGFAWDPFGNGRTAVRSGFGIFDVLPLPYQSYIQLAQSQPFFTVGTLTKVLQGSFPDKALPLLTLGTLKQAYIEHAPKRSYVMQWNLNVQRELAPNLTGILAYVGSRGVHQLFRVDDADVVIPTRTPEGYLFPIPGTGTRINPAFGQITSSFYEGNSYYEALQMGIRKRMSRGFQVQTSFTWSKSIDMNSASVAGDQFATSISSWWNWFDPKLSRAVSDFNVGRTLVINTTWEVPGLKSVSGPLGWVTNGWQLGGIYTASDGVPFTATLGNNGDPLGLGSSDPYDFPNRVPGCSLTNSNFKSGARPFYINNNCFTLPLATPDIAARCQPFGNISGTCANLRGNSGRNILTGPGLSDLDFSLFKNKSIKKISETFRIQFRAEIFNILNHANFAPPTQTNATIFDASGKSLSPQNGGTAGLLSATATDSREIQFALKVIW